MRVLCIAHQFPPVHQGGTEILCLRTAQALAEAGHAVGVIAADPARRLGGAIIQDEVEDVAVWRVPTRRWPAPSTQARIANDFAAPLVGVAVEALARDFAPDVIHVHHLKTIGFEALARVGGLAPTVLTATDFYLACPFVNALLPDGRRCVEPGSDLEACVGHFLETNRWGQVKAFLDDRSKAVGALEARQRAVRGGFAAVDALIAGTDELAGALRRLGAPIGKIRRIDHVAPPSPAPATPMGDTLRIAFFGALSPHKGPHIFIGALNRLPCDLAYEAWLMGDASADPAYAKSLRRDARANPRIKFRQPVPNARFGEAVSQADIVVVPSIWSENRPLVLLAALEARRFAVVSDVEGLTAAFDGDGQGVAFPVGDAAALAAALQGLIRDPGPVRRLRALPAKPSPFQAYVDAIVNEYRRAIAGRMATPALTAPPGRS